MFFRRLNAVILAALLCVSGIAGFLLTGCSSAPAEGKLQIMFSGNIRGNVAPCG
jgi:hypothetical protein